MSNSKRSFSCAACGIQIIALVKDQGTIPHIISECAATGCDGQLWNDFHNVVQMTGKEPTHHLVRNPDAKTDKLELRKVVKNE